MTKIAVNGFGRIGRLTLRRILENHPDLEVTAVNDLMDAETAAYLLKHDSVYGQLSPSIAIKNGEKGANGKLLIGDREVLFFSEPDPLNLPWDKLGVELVIEASGQFTSRSKAIKHLEAGAKRVIISANSDDADLAIIFGVNHEEYSPKKHQIIANNSCTTNCAVPVFLVIDKNFGVEKALFTTVHAVTASQSLIDQPKKNLRESRAAFSNIIPSDTGADKAVAQVLPWLSGKISGTAFRVPVLSGSILEINIQTKKETSVEEINKALEKAATEELKGVLAVSREPLVSSDIVGSSFAAIVDLNLTKVINLPNAKDQNLIKVVAWYDNEYGYCCQLAKLAEYISKQN